MKILEAKGLVKYYGKGDSLVKAVDHSSFSVDKGEFVAVVGTSGPVARERLRFLIL